MEQVASETPAGASRHGAIPHRPEIDGLRGVAVLAVVWFHSGLPGLPGGFAGVDVFFVISGFLITSIIQRDLREGRFSFGYFYQRRFRRIAPALVAVTLATTVGGYVLLLPYELDQFARSAIAAVGMVSNIYFWRTTNYFVFAHGIVPLLHSWSLGVEEQFYLLFPATLVIAQRLGMPRLVVAAAGILSFILCLVTTWPMPAAAFYLLPTRGWELMIGGALAQANMSVPREARQAAGLTGIALAAASFVLLTESMSFPGWRALLPTIATALLIASGRETLAGEALASAPVVYVGRVSYSFYLWHWPIFVFLRHWRADLQLPASWAFGGIAVAFLLSAASYRWIEQPARNRSTPFRHVLVSCLTGAGVIVLASAVAIAGRGLPQRLPRPVVAIASLRNNYAPLAHRCTNVGFDQALKNCRIGPPGEPRLLLWGDSHASAISEAVGQASGVPGLVVSEGACAPVPGWPDGEDPRGCRDANARAFQFAIRDRHVSTVVLSAYWLSLTRDFRTPLWQSQQRVVDALNAAGKKVVVVAGVPDPGVDVPWAGAIRQRFGRPPLQLSCPAAKIPLRRVTLVDVSTGFCRLPAYKLYSDSNHPSRYAALAIVAPAVREAMQGAR